MPRSPRATITQSAAPTISSARSTAWGFSIFAISGRRVCSRTISTSCRRAHERQRDHVDADRLAVASSSRSSSGTAGSDVDRAGDVQPLARGDRAADLDLGVDLALGRCAPRPRAGAPSRRRDRGSSPPRPRRRGPPRRCSCGARRPAPRSSPQTNVSARPRVSSTTSSRSGPIRSFGPGRSWRIATGRPARPAASRTRRTVSACSSSVPCE